VPWPAPSGPRATTAPAPMAERADLFGLALRDWAAGRTEPEILERDDGFTEVGAGHELYVAPVAHWLAAERQALPFVRGRVIDVGCAAGRVALHLQQRGHDVVGLDASPGAVRTARARGVSTAWCLSAQDVAGRMGSFDTVVLFGNNFGIFGTPGRLRRVLTSWARRAPAGARILAGSTNPYGGGAPLLTRGYYFANRRRGLLPGQVTMRIRYRNHVSPWFSWLFVSRAEMRKLLRGTGWQQSEILGGSPAAPYVAVLERDGR
jgi:SAM-dependent methyltransferase